MWWIHRKMAHDLLTLKRPAHVRKALLMSAAAVGVEMLLLVISIHTLPGVLAALARALPTIPHLARERGPGVFFSCLILLLQAALWPGLFVLGAWKSMILLLCLRKEWIKPRKSRLHQLSWHSQRPVDTEKVTTPDLSRVEIPLNVGATPRQVVAVAEAISPSLVLSPEVASPSWSFFTGYAPSTSPSARFAEPQILALPVQEGYLRIGTDSRSAMKRAGWPNEDSLVAIQGQRNVPEALIPFGLVAVADGGGHERGWEASRLATQTLLEVVMPGLMMSGNLPDIALMAMMLKGLREANRVIYQRNLREATMMGAAIAAGLAIGGKAYVVNIGDSRVYHYSPRKGLAQITGDHPSAARLEFSAGQVAVQADRNVTGDYLGTHPGIAVNSFVVKLGAGDGLLLCSDGLWKMVDIVEIEQIMNNTRVSLGQMATVLVQAAIRGNGEDTASAIIAQVAGDV